MYLSRIQIENIRGFRSGRLKVDLDLRRPDGSYAGWTVIAGRNGSGKSTFLKLVALTVAGPVVTRALQASFSGWLPEGEHAGTVAIDIIAEPTRDRFLTHEGAPEEPMSVYFSLFRSDTSPEPMESFRNPNSMVTPHPQGGFIIDGPWAGSPHGWFITGYGSYRRLSGSAEGTRSLGGLSSVSRLASLFRDDISLVESIQWLKEHHLRRLENKSGAGELIESVLTLLNDGLLPDSTRVSQIDSEGLWVTQGGLSFPLSDMSDGYRTITALVLDLARQLQTTYQEFRLVQHHGTWCVPYQGVVLIDEVELHLHVSWQRRIGF